MATVNSIRTTDTPFNPQSALSLLQENADQIAEVNAVAFAAIGMEGGETEPDLTILSLFRVIHHLTEDAAAYDALRNMLEGYEATTREKHHD